MRSGIGMISKRLNDRGCAEIYYCALWICAMVAGWHLYTNVINYKFGMLIIISSRNLSIELRTKTADLSGLSRKMINVDYNLCLLLRRHEGKRRVLVRTSC